MLCCSGNKSDSDDDSFQKVKPTKYKETTPNGVNSSPERAVTQPEVKAVQEPQLQKEVVSQEQREVTPSSKPEKEREGSPESQISFAQQEVADLKQIILQEIQSDSSDEMSQQALLSAVDRLEAVAIRLEGLASKAGTSPSSSVSDSGPAAPFVVDFDGLVSSDVAKFIELSNTIGGDVATVGGMVSKAFSEQRQLLVVASKSKKPADSDLVKVLQPLSECISTVVSFRETNRGSPFFNHLSVLSESLAALGWVTVAPAPGPYVKEMSDAGQFYSNRVLKDYKGKDDGAPHVDWVKTWNAILTNLQSYIKDHHRTGLSWNPQGGDAMSIGKSPAAGGAPAPPPPGGAPPPPPPPPPAPTPEAAGNDSAGGDDGRAQLFASLNKGTDITKGLKKVSDDMKTHKNPKLREGPAPFKVNTGPKPYSKPVAAAKPVAAKPVAADKPPVFELQNKKWVVEYQKGNKNLVIENTEAKQTVYVFKCENSTIMVKGKVNSIVLDNCKKVAIVFDDLVAALEFVNCQSVQGQVQGKMRTVSIDKTDGCQIYLSKDSLDCEIISSKSSEMNILVPKADGDYSEFPLPEQFKTIYNGSKFITSCTESI